MATLREELAGPGLQKDVDDLIDSAEPHLNQAVQQAVQAALQPVKVEVSNLQTQASAEATTWKPIAIGFGIGAAILLICLILAVVLVRNHTNTIRTLVARGSGVE